jgi:5'-nucleotidase
MTTTDVPGPDAMQGFAISGPPGLASMAACLGAFGDPPDVVVSGINSGLNTGHSVLHSGTVGAALTAQNFGRRGLAVSIEPTDPWWWETACAYASSTLEWLVQHTPARTVLNVNVPGRDRADVLGVRWARLDRFGSVRAAVLEAGERGLQLEYRATGAELDPTSDTALVEAGFVTLTAIAGIAEVDVGRDTPPGVDAEQVARELHEAPATR